MCALSVTNCGWKSSFFSVTSLRRHLLDSARPIRLAGAQQALMFSWSDLRGEEFVEAQLLLRRIQENHGTVSEQHTEPPPLPCCIRKQNEQLLHGTIRQHSSLTAATMGPIPKPRKRIKVSSISKAKVKVTNLSNPEFEKSTVTPSRTQHRMTFQCPVTIKTIFTSSTEAQVEQFYLTRCSQGESFDNLPTSEKLAWRESLSDNYALMGFMIYSQLLPSLLKNRIKLNSASYHWNPLDPTCEEGQLKLQQRVQAMERLKRPGSTRSVLKGFPYTVDLTQTGNILQFMKMDVEDEDERFRSFMGREFSMLSSERGNVNGSSVFASCSMALSLMWFSTVVLGRPCSLESIILPLSTVERHALEQRFNCPPNFFDGAVREVQTSWKDVFTCIGTAHRNIDYTMLEKFSGERYIDGLCVADAYAVFRATMSAPGNAESITALVKAYRDHSKHGVDSGAIVGIIDVLRCKPSDSIGKIDGGVLGTIFYTYGEKASLRVQEDCNGKLQGGATLFDDSVSGKLGELITHFDNEMSKARKKHKMEMLIRGNMDPAGLNKKVESGRMLDPCDAKSLELMHGMLKGLSGRVWRPLKQLIGEALGASMEYPSAFLRLTFEEEEVLYKHLVKSRVGYNDIANLCVLLVLSNSFQRSQNLRESTVDEYQIVPDGTHYKLTFKNRRFKTAASTGSSSSPPVTHFIFNPHQSMIVKFISRVGHRFCKVQDLQDDTRRLFLNSKGQNWTQKDIGSRFKKIGLHWLGIDSFCPHTCRSFWSTHALNSGQVTPANVEDFSSFLQVSGATLRNSYMASGGNSAAHTLGSEVLGSVANAACTGATTEQGAAPYGKRLNTRRLEFVGQIRASLAKYGGDTKVLFRDLVQRREAGQLRQDEAWFKWESTFFSKNKERLFTKFIGDWVTV